MLKMLSPSVQPLNPIKKKNVSVKRWDSALQPGERHRAGREERQLLLGDWMRARAGSGGGKGESGPALWHNQAMPSSLHVRGSRVQSQQLSRVL